MHDINMLGSARALLAPVLLFSALSSGVSAQEEEAIAEPKPAVQAELADESLLLDIHAFENIFIAVGARGHVLLSDDGQEWRQAQSVPVQSTLTRVTSVGRRLWAVGHDAVIISSSDGGESWFVQHWAPQDQEPLLDIKFLTPNKGFAIGAYGRFMTTSDGGINWDTHRMTDRVTAEAIDWVAMAREQGDLETVPEEFQDPDSGALAGGAEADVNKGCYDFGECHLNAILNPDGQRLSIAAESGYGFRSENEGETWESFRFPYPGSMFGLVQQRDCIIAFGLRGHVQRSCDFGSNWNELAIDIQQSLMGGDIDLDGTAVLVGSGATRVYIEADGSIDTEADQLGSDYAAVRVTNGSMILVGENGVRYE